MCVVKDVLNGKWRDFFGFLGNLRIFLWRVFAATEFVLLSSPFGRLRAIVVRGDRLPLQH